MAYLWFLGLVLMAGSLSANPIDYSISITQGSTTTVDPSNDISSLVFSSGDGTFVHSVDNLSPLIFEYTVVGDLLQLDFSEFNGAQEIGIFDFSNVLFTSIQHSGSSTSPIESVEFIYSHETTQVPEPITSGLCLMVLVALPLIRRFRRV